MKELEKKKEEAPDIVKHSTDMTTGDWVIYMWRLFLLIFSLRKFIELLKSQRLVGTYHPIKHYNVLMHRLGWNGHKEDENIDPLKPSDQANLLLKYKGDRNGCCKENRRSDR